MAAFCMLEKIDCNSRNSTRCAIVCLSVRQSVSLMLVAQPKIKYKNIHTNRQRQIVRWTDIIRDGMKRDGEFEVSNILIKAYPMVRLCVSAWVSACPLLALTHSLSWHKKAKTIHTRALRENPFKLEHDSCHNVIHKFSIELVIQSN